ncbi:MAG: rod shape-determining protein RodA [Planctomycetota bacterium]|nr:MAG: rod shape-determining protein RodA [Planctomycetota bacterium]
MSARSTGPFGLGRVLSARHVRWFEVDWHILIIAGCLLLFGLLFLNAMDGSLSNQYEGDIDFSGHLKKVLLTSPLILVGMLVRPGWLRRNAHVLYFACLVLLALVPFIGDERNNARRWIQLPMFDLQPSELAKLGVILMLAKILHRSRLKDLEDWMKPAFVAFVPMGMVVLQPDLGTALTIVPITLGMLYLAGARGRALFMLVACGLFVGYLGVRAGMVKEYQLKRVDTWVDSYQPEDLIQERNRLGFHVYHARTAIGNGGWLGTGLGRGIANETGHLPERDSDSIFAVIAEESGFIGAGALLFLYTLLVILLMASAAGLRDRFSRLVVGGVALYFAAHVFINAAVNLGLLPMTGLTLPLFSTGGSSLLVTFLALGLALGLASHHTASLDQDSFRTY